MSMKTEIRRCEGFKEYRIKMLRQRQSDTPLLKMVYVHDEEVVDPQVQTLDKVVDSSPAGKTSAKHQHRKCFK